MGVYDNIRCKYPLPNMDHLEDIYTWPFQTKDLDSSFDDYVIGRDGKLYQTHRDGKVFGEPERVYYSGAITFSDYHNKVYYEFAALFDSGQLLQVVCVTPRKSRTEFAYREGYIAGVGAETGVVPDAERVTKSWNESLAKREEENE